MKLKIGQLQMIQISLVELAKNKLSIKLNYLIDKWLERIALELKTVDKSRTKLADKYCQKDDKGQLIIKNNLYQYGDNLDKANKEYEELMNEEIEFDLKPLVLDVLDESIKIETGYQKALYPILDPECLKTLE